MMPIAPDKWFNDILKRDGGIFERRSFDVMMGAVKNFRVAIDVGSHVGSWSLGMAERFEEVICFEAYAENYKYLIKNIATTPNIRPHLCAIGDVRYDRVSIAAGEENSGMSHIATRDDMRASFVRMSTLDALVAPEIDVDLIKIDVEGYELPVLRGAEDTIERCSPVILVELGGHGTRYGHSDEAVQDYLTELGYALYGVHNKDYVYVREQSTH